MNPLMTGIKNSQTTLAGGALGVLWYLHEVGVRIPETVEEAVSTAIALALAYFGMRAKDASTGSQPR